MRCPNCNEENPSPMRFCRRCGSNLRGTTRMRGAIGSLLSLLVVVCLVVWIMKRPSTAPSAELAISAPRSQTPAAQVEPAAQPITLGIAYGTEKRDWLTWAVSEFAKTPEGREIHIDLKPMGSLDAAHAIIKGDKSIQVWSPASALYRDVFVRDYKDSHAGANPILSEAPLALTPMVFVSWEQRYDAFIKHYNEMNFRTIGQAMQEKSGWATIANEPEWMFFKFSHTKPDSSNSGLMTLLLMGYDYHGKQSGLNGRDITDEGFATWMRSIEKSLTGAASGLTASTGDLMTSMVQRGWSTYDVIFVYESVAIDRVKQANGRWGQLKIIYPKYNMWNDNPYCILDVPSSSEAQRRAAKVFADFLLSERVQREAMVHGFRPANVQVPTNAPDSPFTLYQNVGIRPDAPGIFCEPPKAEVIENLLLAWERSQAELH